MKTNQINRWLGKATLSIALLMALIFSPKAEANNYRGVSFQVFYDALTPYGDWVKDARHGYIWLPAVYDDFHPYGTDGRWVMTEYGNTWVSDYDWGWATFHYGRWYFDDYYQSWAWIPGYDWAPAWVSWRTGGGYYGWAPLGPGVSINVRINIPSHHWVFLPHARIYHPYAYQYYAPYRTKVKIINRTTVINNTVVYNNYNFYGGPSRREVERTTRRVVPVYNLKTSDAPGRMAVSRNEVSVYRPELEQGRGRTVDARPSRVLDADQAKTARSGRQVSPSNSGVSSQPSRSAGSSNGSIGRTQAPSGRSAASSSRNEDQGFDMKPAPSNSERTAPSRSAQPSRQGQVRTQPQPSRESQVRTQPQSSRESQVRTQPQPAQRGSVQQRSSTPTRESQVRQPQQRTESRPQVRTSPSAPSHSSDSRVAQPSRGQSSRPEVKSSAPQRSNSSEGKNSGNSSGRGNSRDRNN
jgi:hypothetical protein